MEKGVDKYADNSVDYGVDTDADGSEKERGSERDRARARARASERECLWSAREKKGSVISFSMQR